SRPIRTTAARGRRLCCSSPAAAATMRPARCSRRRTRCRSRSGPISRESSRKRSPPSAREHTIPPRLERMHVIRMHKGSVSAPRRLAALGLALVLLAPEARAQSTGEQTPVVDYNRAERFLRWHVQDLIAGDEVRPQWLADGNRFWYRNKLADGAAEFVLIDPVRNTRSLVFDNAKLAAAMSVANDTAYDPAKLPFRTFEFVEGERVIEFEARRKRFRCDIVSYTCTVGETQPNRVAFVASPDSTWEAFVHEHDLWIRPMAGGDSIRLTTDGEEYWAYGLTRPRPTEMMNPRPRRPQLRWSPD